MLEASPLSQSNHRERRNLGERENRSKKNCKEMKKYAKKYTKRGSTSNFLRFNCFFGPLIITTVILKKVPAITKMPHTAWAHALSLLLLPFLAQLHAIQILY